MEASTTALLKTCRRLYDALLDEYGIRNPELELERDPDGG